MSKILLKVGIAGNLSDRPELVEPPIVVVKVIYLTSPINSSLTLESLIQGN